MMRFPSLLLILALFVPGCSDDDGGTPDSGTPDSGTPDSGTPDSGTPDSGTPDSGTPDSGTPDSGTPDGGPQPCAAPPCTTWAQAFGNESDQWDKIAVAAAANGDVVVTGVLTGTLDFGGGPITAPAGQAPFLARFDAAGNHLWSKRLGGPGKGNHVTIDQQGNLLVTGQLGTAAELGQLPGPAYLAKLDAAGNLQWARGASGVNGVASAADAAGNIFVGASCEGTVDLGGGPLTCEDESHVLIAKLDAAGEHLWSRVLLAPGTGTDDQYGRGIHAIAADATGNLFIAGTFNVLDFGAGRVTSNGYAGAFVAKFDGQGNHLWTRTVATGESQGSDDIVVDADGNAFVVGTYSPTQSFYGGEPLDIAYRAMAVVKLDPDGNVLWRQHYTDLNGQSDGPTGRGIAMDPAGNLAITGLFGGEVDFGGGPLPELAAWDVYVVKLDASGNHLWSKVYGGSGFQYGLDVAMDAMGRVIAAGAFYEAIDFGLGSLASVGGLDFFLAQLVP